MLCASMLEVRVRMTVIRTYSEAIKRPTFLERFQYLALRGQVGISTFGFDRHLNQAFYKSREWRRLRSDIIARDEGRDLGVEGFEIHDRVLIHHINPVAVEDIVDRSIDILNPEYLICVSHKTHNAIHFGDENQLPRLPLERKAGDTNLW